MELSIETLEMLREDKYLACDSGAEIPQSGVGEYKRVAEDPLIPSPSVCHLPSSTFTSMTIDQHDSLL